jgi:hypothetical protein
LYASNKPNITTANPPKTLQFEVFHFDMGNPLEKPAMTGNDEQQVAPAPAVQQPAQPAPSINIIIPSGRKLKDMLQNNSSSPNVSHRSNLKRTYRSPSPSEVNPSDKVNQTVGDWLHSVSNTPDVKHIDLEDLHSRLAKHRFIDVPLKFLNGLPRSELLERPLRGRDKWGKFM